METRPIAKTWKPTVAGILEIVDGTFSLMVAAGLSIASVVLRTMPAWAGINESDFAPFTVSEVASILVFAAAVVFILAVLELVGGIFALQRKRWGLALAGSIAAALPTNAMGVLAIIFLALAKNEFTDK